MNEDTNIRTEAERPHATPLPYAPPPPLDGNTSDIYPLPAPVKRSRWIILVCIFLLLVLFIGVALSLLSNFK